MNHFPIAFGTIVVVAIGGALVLDHVWLTPPANRSAPSTLSKAAKPTPAPTPNIGETKSGQGTVVAKSDEEITASTPQPEETPAPKAKNPSKHVADAKSVRHAASTPTSPSRRSAEDSEAPASESSSNPASVAVDNATASGNPSPSAAPAAETSSAPVDATTPAASSTAPAPAEASTSAASSGAPADTSTATSPGSAAAESVPAQPTATEANDSTK